MAMTKDFIDRIKRITAYMACNIANKQKSGTAFALDAELIITCAHCLREEKTVSARPAPHIEVWFYDAQEGSTSSIQTEILWDGFTEKPPVDLALLKPKSPLPLETFLPLGTAPDSGSYWQSFGYPILAGQTGLRFDGIVSHKTDRYLDMEVDAIILECKQTQGRDPWNGASGSPVVVDGKIVGVICDQPLREGRPAYGILAAIALADALSAAPETIISNEVLQTYIAPAVDDAANNLKASGESLPLQLSVSPPVRCRNGEYALGIRLVGRVKYLADVRNVTYWVGEQHYEVTHGNAGFRCAARVSKEDRETNHVRAKVIFEGQGGRQHLELDTRIPSEQDD